MVVPCVSMKLNRKAPPLQEVDMVVPTMIAEVVADMAEAEDTVAEEEVEEEVMAVDMVEEEDTMIDTVDNHPRPTMIAMADTLAADMEAADTAGDVVEADTVDMMTVLPTVVEVSDVDSALIPYINV